MRLNQEELGKVRGYVFAAVAVAVLIAYLLSR